MLKEKKKKIEHDNADRWLLTYADLITLLLGLFVILYGMSKIDAVKYSQVVVALGGVFGGEKVGAMTGKTGVMLNEVNSLQQERTRIMKEIGQAIGQTTNPNLVNLTQNERGVTIHLMEELLFPSGSAELKQSSVQTMDAIALVLQRIPNDIRIEGHTDNVPIHTDRFPSNWHLSVDRALAAGFFMINKHGLNPEKVSVVGYSEYRPLMPNTSAENRLRNRRVDIVIVTNVVHGSTNGSGISVVPSSIKEMP
jgi:chemotaxis protein MotB